MNRYYVVVLVIAIASQLSLFGMDKPFHFDRMEPELQNVVIMFVDDLSYIGQTNKSCYAQVKKQQLYHIVDMHGLQDPRLAKPNIPPFVFFIDPSCDDHRGNGKRAIDPNSRIFYKDSTWEKYPLGCGAYHDTFHIDFNGDDKYQRVGPTNLLIACLMQKECAAQRLVRFYPLAPQHVIAGDSQSKKLYEDFLTPRLFLEALCASKMIPNNKATAILLEHLEKAHMSESSLEKRMRVFNCAAERIS